MNATIRPARIEDADRLAALFNAIDSMPPTGTMIGAACDTLADEAET